VLQEAEKLDQAAQEKAEEVIGGALGSMYAGEQSHNVICPVENSFL